MSSSSSPSRTRGHPLQPLHREFLLSRPRKGAGNNRAVSTATASSSLNCPGVRGGPGWSSAWFRRYLQRVRFLRRLAGERPSRRRPSVGSGRPGLPLRRIVPRRCILRPQPGALRDVPRRHRRVRRCSHEHGYLTDEHAAAEDIGNDRKPLVDLLGADDGQAG
jgi:hypothetical protein